MFSLFFQDELFDPGLRSFQKFCSDYGNVENTDFSFALSLLLDTYDMKVPHTLCRLSSTLKNSLFLLLFQK